MHAARSQPGEMSLADQQPGRRRLLLLREQLVKAEAVRAILAKHIIEAAKQGERDHTRLRDGALLALAQSNLRNSAAAC
jgi:hypothetical protein